MKTRSQPNHKSIQKDNLESILQYLITELSPNSLFKEEIILWIRQLDPIEDIAFISNLYIELNNGNISKHAVREILDNICVQGLKGKSSFFEIANKYDKLLCCNIVGPYNRRKKDTFLRFMTLESFCQHYLLDDFGIPPTIEGQMQALQMFFQTSPNGIKENDLELISKPWKGVLNNVWVTTNSELERIQKKFKLQSLPDTICICLGFEISKNKHIVYFSYPVDGFNFDFVKPTTFDAHHKVNKYYISTSKPKSKGLTCTLNKEGSSMIEFVHKAMPNGLTKEFSGEHLGKTSYNNSMDYNHFYTTISRRVTKITK